MENVKKAHWEQLYGAAEGLSRCSECKDGIIKTDWEHFYHYCPNCGSEITWMQPEVIPVYE